jgi:asparagine synthetase B (glutamine-hydrolysing)
MNKHKIANYLKFGFTEDLWYNEPYSIIDIPWEDAIEGYKHYYETALESVYTENALCALSGGLDSSLNIFHIKSQNPLVYSYVIDGNTDHIYAQKLAEFWNLKNFTLIHSSDLNLEKELINMNSMWTSPRCVTGDLHTYDAYLKAKLISDTLLAGVGSEPMSLGIGWMYGPIIALASVRREYDYHRAKIIIDNSKYIDPLYREQYNAKTILASKTKNYSQVIKELFELGLFSDESISFMGLEPPVIELREDSLSHALQCTYDWYNPNMIGKRYPILEKELELKTVSPYFSKELRAFCFSLPIEYRFCLGSERHVMRNYIADKLPEFVINRNKEPFQPKIDWFFSNSKQIDYLVNMYLLNVNRKIYNYINFDSIVTLLDRITDYQRWSLLNLSIWLEVNQNESK